MFKKLRRKFMWMSTVILFLVISLVVCIMYRIASGTIMSQTRILMEEILDNDGSLPVQWEFDSDKRIYLALSPESLYETRYYTALINDTEVSIDHMHIAMKEDEAEHIAERIYKKRKDYGSLYVSGGRTVNYMKKPTDDGTFIVVLDCTSRYNLIRVITIYLSALWFAVLILYIVFMGRYSQKLIKPFIENDEKQKRFITNASHELKTPLAVISSNTEMIETMGGKSKWTESTRRQVGKLQNLIEDLVVLSRLDEMQDIVLARTDLSVITNETAESFRSVAEDSGRTFISEINPDVYAMAEKRSYQQLVSILMDNASKYCDKDGEIRVALTARSRGKGARLTVSNTYAEGKDVDYSRFFERFYREDASHNSSLAGFGIGLSMGKEIAERLGGDLKVSYSGDTISFEISLG
jgi:signal transduction histidine kinase